MFFLSNIYQNIDIALQSPPLQKPTRKQTLKVSLCARARNAFREVKYIWLK